MYNGVVAYKPLPTANLDFLLATSSDCAKKFLSQINYAPNLFACRPYLAGKSKIF